MIPALARPGAAVALLSAALIVAAGFASTGLFNIDEVVYALGVAAARSGSHVIENGDAAFGSEDLRIWLLTLGPSGLVSQYPVGSSWAGAALAPLFGGRALMALNLAAGIATLAATHALALALFGSRQVALLAVLLLALATFWAEYVLGFWPHSVSILCTTLALFALVKALPAEARAWRAAALSGLAVGLGLTFRLDGVLLLPAIAVVTILWAARPVQVLAGGALGLAPMLGLLSLTNHAKFGTWSPLSYGRSGGAVAVSDYLTEGLVLLVGLALLAGLRFVPAPGPRARRAILIAGITALALGLVSPVAPQLWRLIHGAQAILLDATAIADTRPGVLPQMDGTILFWGLPKKALAQSLPWLGALAYLIGAGRGVQRRSVALVLVVAGLWALPFALRAWHGGLGSNMRYLLPILPALASLVAWIVTQLIDRATGGRRVFLGGVVVAFALGLIWLALVPAKSALLHQILSTWVFLAVAVTSLWAGFAGRPLPTLSALAAIGAGVGLAAALAGADIFASQKVRAKNAARSAISAQIEGPVIFFGPPEGYASAIGAPDRLLALWSPESSGGAIDPSLVSAACARGYRIVMRTDVARTAGLPADQLAAVAGLDPALAEGLAEVACR
ncbi:MAG: glycosyltransferase family 39 protein [Maritimibacter sp.]|nr:glycosyltransferase family 39 protein [Maritimibacter sp.]